MKFKIDAEVIIFGTNTERDGQCGKISGYNYRDSSYYIKVINQSYGPLLLVIKEENIKIESIFIKLLKTSPKWKDINSMRKISTQNLKNEKSPNRKKCYYIVSIEGYLSDYCFNKPTWTKDIWTKKLMNMDDATEISSSLTIDCDIKKFD